MGNRIIKESICTSEDLNKLSPMAEILFYRLITKADDYGCFYGNEAIIKSYCFPLRSDEAVPPKSVRSWIQEIANAGIIHLYTAEDGKRYLQFVKWNLHQEIRTQKHKFPTFEEVCSKSLQTETDCDNLQQTETDCDNLQQTAANCGLRARARGIQSNPNTIQSESESEKESNPKHEGGRDYETDELFESFWKAYPKKTGDIRQAYIEYQHAVQSGTPPDTIIRAAVELCAEVEPDQIQFLTSAERWLRNKGWLTPAKEGGKANGRKPSTGKPGSGKVSGEAGRGQESVGFKYDV